MTLSATPKTPRLLTKRQACERLGVSRWTLQRWVKSGQAPAPVENIPGWPRWREDDIDDFARGRGFGVTGRRYFTSARQAG